MSARSRIAVAAACALAVLAWLAWPSPQPPSHALAVPVAHPAPAELHVVARAPAASRAARAPAASEVVSPEQPLERHRLRVKAPEIDGGVALLPAEGGAGAQRDRSQVATAWSAESVDQDWSRAVEEQLTSSFEDLSTDADIVDVSCRTTVCRVQLRFATTNEAARYLEEAALPDALRWLTMSSSEGALTVETFVARAAP